jgi:PAS domain S-box-containing protein
MYSLPTLLIVEDEAVTGMAEARSLEQEGYRVIHVLNGEDALELFHKKEHRIDLILMDIDLGRGMDGTITAQEILKTNDIPVLFLSAHTENEIVEKTEKITSYGYVVKNSGITVLTASIKMAFKLHGAYKNIEEQKMEIEAVNEELQSAVEQMEATNIELEKANRELTQFQHELMERDKVLKDNVERYHAIFDQSPVGVLMFDRNLICIDCNEQLGRIMSSSREKIIGVDLNRLSEQAVVPSLRETLGGSASSYEGPYHATTSDAFIYISFTMSPIHDVNGGIIGGMGVILDITGRKRAEEALKKSESHYRLLAENMDDVVWVTDNNLKFTYISPSIRRLRGFEPREASRESPIESFTPESLEKINQIYTGALPAINKGENPVHLVEVEQYRKDGSRVWVEILIKVFRDEKGTRMGFIGVSRDISERKRLGRVLEESEGRFRTLIESAPMAIAISRDTRFTYVNQKFLQMFGYEKMEDLIGRPISVMVTEQDAAVFMDRSRKREEGVAVENRYAITGLRRNGTRFPVTAAVARAEFPDGPATIGFFQDNSGSKF